jgi:hypothetical protein
MIRAILLASATATSMRGLRASMRSNHEPVRLQMVWDNLSCLGTEVLARLG